MHATTSTQAIKKHFANARRERSRAFIQFLSFFLLPLGVMQLRHRKKGQRKAGAAPANAGI